MNTTRQTQDLAMTQAEVHMKVSERWMRAAEPNVPAQSVEARERASSKIIDAWENSVKVALRAQLNWVRLWMRTFGEDEEAPKEVVEWSRLTYEMMEAWTEAQLELWDAWFARLRKAGPHKSLSVRRRVRALARSIAQQPRCVSRMDAGMTATQPAAEHA